MTSELDLHIAEILVYLLARDDGADRDQARELGRIAAGAVSGQSTEPGAGGNLFDWLEARRD